MQGVFFLIFFSSLLRNGVRATLLSLQPAYVGHTPEAGLISRWGLVCRARRCSGGAHTEQQQKQPHSLRLSASQGSTAPVVS